MVLKGALAIALTVVIASGPTAADRVGAQGHGAEPLPPLKILSPANGATVKSPVIVVFETPADLSKMTMGSHMKETDPHLHIDIDKRITMPTITQLTQISAHRYSFSVGRVKLGRHVIRVYWADAKVHKPLSPVQLVTITVK
jgi:hypothetical protein